MKYTGPFFRPPPEASTPLLQVTVGCAHNKCTYCTMYRSVSFTVEQMDQIEKDIRELHGAYGAGLKRIFLLNGDAFVLSAGKLKEISDKLLEYFPHLETITTYASVRNIMTKSDEELKILKEARYDELYIGIETGHRELLASMNKGYSLDDVYEQLPRLTRAGIGFIAAMMLGAGGKGRGLEVADATAVLLDHIKPITAGYTTIGIFEGSELAEKTEKGLFVPATEKEVIEELIRVIEMLTVEGIGINNIHRLNAIRTDGVLPRDRERMLDGLKNALEQQDQAFLDSSIVRSSL